MAAKGLHLDKMARYFAWFDRGEPMQNVRFRLEPVTREDDWVTQEEREGYLEMGWEYLDTWENLYRIYRADDPDPVPLMYQAGYLTIRDADPMTGEYTLAVPNGEVRYGLEKGLLPAWTA